jgi:hypothetical protein
MPTRDELKALIDQLSEVHLDAVGMMLQHRLNPPPPRPEIEHMQQRGMDYRKNVLKRFRETRKPGTLGTGGGTGFSDMHEGVPFGRQGFHYWDDKALVHQSLQFFDGHEIEVMERLSFSPDRTSLVCALEITSGGRTVRYQDDFPTSRQDSPEAT